MKAIMRFASSGVAWKRQFIVGWWFVYEAGPRRGFPTLEGVKSSRVIGSAQSWRMLLVTFGDVLVIAPESSAVVNSHGGGEAPE